MIRFDSGYQSIKFRSLSVCRLASLHPAAAARRDGTALSPKWPPLKVLDEVRGPPRCCPGHNEFVRAQQYLATSRRERSSQLVYQPDLSIESRGRKGSSSPEQNVSTHQQTPIERMALFSPNRSNRLLSKSMVEVDPSPQEQLSEWRGESLKINNDESVLKGMSSNSSLTAPQDKEKELAKDEMHEETEKNGTIVEKTENANEEILPSVTGTVKSKIFVGGISRQDSMTESREVSQELGEKMSYKTAEKVSTKPSKSPIGIEQPHGRKILDMTPAALTAAMCSMRRSQKVALMKELTGHIKRAARGNTSHEMAHEYGPDLEVMRENAVKAHRLLSQLGKAIPKNLHRQLPVNRKPTLTKLCPRSQIHTQSQISTPQPGSLRQLPTIDKNDLNPVMAKKGNSYSAVKLGKGVYGEVVLMQRQSDGTLMAVKKLTNVRNECRASEDFNRETEAMNDVSSSGAFPKFLGTVDHYSFAMEFLGSLDKRSSWSAYQMSKKWSKIMRSLDWLKVSTDFTKGLMDMHEAGWTHNDLHNNNVMVCRDPKTQSWEGKIIDLGFASRIDNPPTPEQMTPQQKRHCFKNCAQLAPEIIEGTSRYNPMSDVYSLGQLFLDIAPQSRKLSCLKSLGKRCTDKTPHKRPNLDEVLKQLTEMYTYRLNQPRKTGILKTLYRSVKTRLGGLA